MSSVKPLWYRCGIRSLLLVFYERLKFWFLDMISGLATKVKSDLFLFACKAASTPHLGSLRALGSPSALLVKQFEAHNGSKTFEAL